MKEVIVGRKRGGGVEEDEVGWHKDIYTHTHIYTHTYKAGKRIKR